MLAAFRAGQRNVSMKGKAVRGNFLRGLFLGDYGEKAGYRGYRGTRIVNTNISDVLNMEFCEIKFPVRFRRCSFAQEIKLRQLKCPELDFRGCTLKKGLDALGAKVAGSVKLNKVKATAQVSLAGADIGGQLDCTGGIFGNKKKIALNAQHIKVAEDVLLEKVDVYGKVIFTSAKIEARLMCRGGSFWNKGKGIALDAYNIKVATDVVLDEVADVVPRGEKDKEFNANGVVRLSGADIGGQFICNRGSFQNKGKNALEAYNIKVAEDVFLAKGFKANGKVVFSGAEIKGSVYLGKTSGKNPNKSSDSSDGQFVAEGKVTFRDAHIGGNLVLGNCKLTKLTLAGANVSGKLEDDAEVYKDDQGNIDLDIDGFRYQRLDAVKKRVKDRLAWVGLMSKGGKFYPQPYEQLMQVYRSTGHTNWARDVGFALEQKRQQAMKSRCWKVWYWILRTTIGYGYKPFRFLGWFSGIILGGGLLFSGGLEVFGLAVLAINFLAVGMFEKTPKLLWIGLLGFILCVSSAMAPCAKWESAESFWKHIPTVLTGVTEWDGCETWRMRPTQPVVYLDGGEKTGSEERPGNHPQFIPLLYAAETAFPLFPLGQTGNWHPATWWVKLIQWFITLLGTVALAILVLYGAGLLGPRWRDK